MQILILKLNATGDVVRTTTLLHLFGDGVTWITAARNRVLLTGLDLPVRALSWEDRSAADDREYDLVVNLEDDLDVAAFAAGLVHRRQFGAYFDGPRNVRYTDDSRGWFDMSLISVHGRARADALKLANRRTYQELVFEGLGHRFAGEPYVLPRPVPTDLTGDVALAPAAGPVWPMKGWMYYDELRESLRARGLVVNDLVQRESLLEHLGDIANHRCIVGGDSLPMHLALGMGVRCVTLFNCTSPWEIYGYGLQAQIVSPLLSEFFYQRGRDERAMRAIPLNAVLDAVLRMLDRQ
jgi:ADP-heptose:LPS heptosyltransferase